MKEILLMFSLSLVGQWLYNFFTGRRTDWSILGAVACKGIEDDIELDCDYPISGGVNDRLILFNHADITITSRDPSNPRIITGVALASGARGYTIEGKNSSNEPDTNFVKKTFSGAWEHLMIFKIFRSDPVVKKNVENFGSAKVVALIQNNYVNATGDSVFEFYGLGSGLELNTAKRSQNNEELMGAWEIELKSNPKALEQSPPLTFFNTDYTTTLAAVEALIV